jgi:hypothetical protein
VPLNNEIKFCEIEGDKHPLSSYVVYRDATTGGVPMQVYEHNGDSFQFTDNFQIQRIKAKYPFLFPLPLKNEVAGQWGVLQEKLDKLNYRKGVIFCCPRDYMKSTYLYGIHRMESYISLRMIGGDDLLNIWLGKEEEETTLSSLTEQVLGIYLGYGEMRNARLEELVLNCLTSSSVRKDQRCWIYYKGSLGELQTKYSKVVEAARELKYSITEYLPRIYSKQYSEKKTFSESDITDKIKNDVTSIPQTTETPDKKFIIPNH